MYIGDILSYISIIGRIVALIPEPFETTLASVGKNPIVTALAVICAKKINQKNPHLSDLMENHCQWN